MDEAPKTNWTMPGWMEPYRGHFAETGGNRIEDLVNDLLNRENIMRTNEVRAALAMCVWSQILLLHRLKANGLLPERAPS